MVVMKVSARHARPGENRLLKWKLEGYMPNGLYVVLPFFALKEALAYAIERGWKVVAR